MKGIAGEISIDGVGETTSVKEYSESPESDQWKESIAEELNDLRKKGTFKKEPPPRGVVPIKKSFVFEIERTADGNVERFKSTLVAKG